MSFTKIRQKQTVFLERYLRGTNKTLTEAQATALFGIKNLRARMAEMRKAGLVVRTTKTKEGKTAYAVSSRNVFGSRQVSFF
jgi:hypothetical protein